MRQVISILQRKRNAWRLLWAINICFFAPVLHGSIVVTTIQDSPTRLELNVVWNDVAGSVTPSLTFWAFTLTTSGPVAGIWTVSGSVQHIFDPSGGGPGGLLTATFTFPDSEAVPLPITSPIEVEPHGAEEDLYFGTATRIPGGPGSITTLDFVGIHTPEPYSAPLAGFGLVLLGTAARLFRGRRSGPRVRYRGRS